MRKEWDCQKNSKTYDFILTPIKNPEGSISQLIIFRDITERKRLEDMLKESEETIKSVLDSTDDAMFLVDASGNFIEMNETVLRKLGKRKDELVGACVYDLLNPDIAKSRKAHIDEVVLTGRTVRFEDERNGEWVDNSIYPIFDEKGKVARVVIYGRYITERKKAEDELKRVRDELREKAGNLERFNRLMVGREMEMVRLKVEVNELLLKAGKAKKYEAPDEIGV